MGDDRLKPQYPPQGGEGRLCLSLALAFLLSVLSAVTVIYSTVMVYAPALKEIESGFRDGETKICTTRKAELNLQGAEKCAGWSSCEEWCLGVSSEACSHVYASVRERGANVSFSGCKMQRVRKRESH